MRALKDLYKHFSSRYQHVFLDYQVDPTPRYDTSKGPHKLLRRVINENRMQYVAVLNDLMTFKPELALIPSVQQNEDSPFWKNEYLPALDMAVLYSMISTKRPNQYIEIGSGNSTKVAALAIKNDQLTTTITCIDPQPRANISSIVDRHIRSAFEKLDFFKEIAIDSGDILFIDNSHRLLPNSDVMVLFLEILPQLPTGVIVHLHDIYLPFDYPQFMCDRFYSEQYMLAAFLINNPERYHTICPNYFISEDDELSQVYQSLWDIAALQGVERHGGSYWLEIR